MNEIIELFNIDFTYVFIAVFSILTCLKVIISLFEWIIGKFGLETKWMRQKRKERELLIQTSQNLVTLQEKHVEDMKKSDEHDAEMRNDIKELTDLFVNKQINDYRWEIINLADKISGKKFVSKECLRHAISTYEKYEKIIEESYQNKLKDGS